MSLSREIIDQLNQSLQLYSDRFSDQFHLQIPRNTITKVQHFRDSYFGYLKNSVYKSNICYLMQLIDYQIWLYKIFRPGLSLENTWFYQLLVTVGIVSEAIAAALLINPLITEDPKDPSLGSVDQRYHDLSDHILKNSFNANLKVIAEIGILPADVVTLFEEIRKEVRNLVHIQNWEGRLYQNLDQSLFSQHLKKFNDFLGKTRSNIVLTHSPETLFNYFFGVGEADPQGRYSGVIKTYHKEKGYGFIDPGLNKGNIYFHISGMEHPGGVVTSGMEVRFFIEKGKKGFEARSIVVVSGSEPGSKE